MLLSTLMAIQDVPSILYEGLNMEEDGAHDVPHLFSTHQGRRHSNDTPHTGGRREVQADANSWAYYCSVTRCRLDGPSTTSLQKIAGHIRALDVHRSDGLTVVDTLGSTQSTQKLVMHFVIYFQASRHRLGVTQCPPCSISERRRF